MIAAIAAASSEADARVSMQGARATCYLFYNTGSGLCETLPNPAAQTERGAGRRAAAFLISRHVDKVIAGDFGPKFRTELENANITCVKKTGAVSKIIAELNDCS